MVWNLCLFEMVNMVTNLIISTLEYREYICIIFTFTAAGLIFKFNHYDLLIYVVDSSFSSIDCVIYPRITATHINSSFYLHTCGMLVPYTSTNSFSHITGNIYLVGNIYGHQLLCYVHTVSEQHRELQLYFLITHYSCPFSLFFLFVCHFDSIFFSFLGGFG